MRKHVFKRALEAAANWRHPKTRDDTIVIEGFRRHLQLDRYSCGVQCAYSVLYHFGRARSIDAITKLLNPTPDKGTPYTRMVRLFRQRGLSVGIRSKARLSDLESAIDDEKLVIASVDNEEHWVVVYGYSPTHFFIADPSLRRKVGNQIARKAFRGRWDNWALVVAPRS